MSDKKLTKEQLVAALQLLLDELNPKEVNMKDPGVHVLDFDDSYVANAQVENRGQWIEYLISHYNTNIDVRDKRPHEKLSAAELDDRKPIKWSKWYTPEEPKVSIFQVFEELTRKKAVVEIDYTINIDGVYQTLYEEKSIRTVRYLDFGKINWKGRFDKTMSNLNSWIDCHLETVDNWERGNIRNYVSQYILGFIGYLADASKYNSVKSSEPKTNARLCLEHILGYNGVYAKKKPERSISITINAVRAYEPMPEGIDIDVTDVHSLLCIRNDEYDIQYAILDTMCQYSYGQLVPHCELST